MKFTRFFRLRRKSTSTHVVELGDSNYGHASASVSSSTTSSASSSSATMTLTIPVVHAHLIPTSRSGPLQEDSDDEDSDFDFEDRFIPITSTMYLYPEIIKDLPHIECLGVCKSHPHVLKAQYRHPSSSSSSSSSSSGITTPVVIKIEDLCSPRSDSGSVYKHSRHEAAIFNTLNSSKYSHIQGHAYIVQLYDHQIFDALNKHVFIYEYCQYGTLFTVMNGFGHLITPNERMQWALDISRGLAYMHEMDVAHRDIKLENIGLCWSVVEKRVIAKILDLGFSNFYQSSVYELQFSGSADHFAPEMLNPAQRRRGYHPVLADLWAYAVTLYCLFESTKPFPQSVNSLEHPHLTSCKYYKPQIMAGVPSFDHLMRSYFTEDFHSRPPIQHVLDTSEFFLSFPGEPIRDIELFSSLQQRKQRYVAKRRK